MTRWRKRDETALREWAQEQEVEAATKRLISQLTGVPVDRIDVATLKPCRHLRCRIRGWWRRHHRSVLTGLAVTAQVAVLLIVLTR